MALEKSRHEFCAAPMLFAPRMFRLWAGGDASSIAADSNKKDIEDGEGAAALDDEDGIIPTVMVQKKGLRDKSTPVRGRCASVCYCLSLFEKTRGPLHALSLLVCLPTQAET